MGAVGFKEFGAARLGVFFDNDCFVARCREGPDELEGEIGDLDALAYAYRAGAENDYLLFGCVLFCQNPRLSPILRFIMQGGGPVLSRKAERREKCASEEMGDMAKVIRVATRDDADACRAIYAPIVLSTHTSIKPEPPD